MQIIIFMKSRIKLYWSISLSLSLSLSLSIANYDCSNKQMTQNANLEFHCFIHRFETFNFLCFVEWCEGEETASFFIQRMKQEKKRLHAAYFFGLHILCIESTILLLFVVYIIYTLALIQQDNNNKKHIDAVCGTNHANTQSKTWIILLLLIYIVECQFELSLIVSLYRLNVCICSFQLFSQSTCIASIHSSGFNRSHSLVDCSFELIVSI